MRVPLEIEVAAPVINVTMAPGTPLMCSADRAAELFGISPRTLQQLRKRHEDFPAKCVGRSVWYLVPEMYAWFRDYPGAIPTE